MLIKDLYVFLQKRPVYRSLVVEYTGLFWQNIDVSSKEDRVRYFLETCEFSQKRPENMSRGKIYGSIMVEYQCLQKKIGSDISQRRVKSQERPAYRSLLVEQNIQVYWCVLRRRQGRIFLGDVRILSKETCIQVSLGRKYRSIMVEYWCVFNRRQGRIFLNKSFLGEFSQKRPAYRSLLRVGLSCVYRKRPIYKYTGLIRYDICVSTKSV